MSSWLKRGAVAVAAMGFVASGLVLGASPAAAVEALPAQDSCIYGDREYSHGAVIRVGDIYIQCQNGSWSIINPVGTN